MRLILDNANVFNVKSRRFEHDSFIVIDGDVISAVGSGAPASSSPYMGERVDLRGQYVIPGLIDGHVHLTFGPRLQPGESPSPLERAAANLERAVRAGVTSVVDLGGSITLRSYLDGFCGPSGATLGRAFVSGPIITAVGGHGTEPFFDDSVAVTVAGERLCRDAVKRAVSGGASVIKLAIDGTTTVNRLSTAEITAIVEEAHAHGLRVAAHAHFDKQAIADAIHAGCDVIQHACALDPVLLARMARDGIALCPTLLVHTVIRERPQAYGGPSSPLSRAVAATYASHRRLIREAAEAGVTLVAGTDAGMRGVHFGNLVLELRELIACGISVGEAIACATRNAADAYNLGRVGSIQRGYVADMLILPGDPMANLAEFENVQTILVGGRPISAAPEVFDQG